MTGRTKDCVLSSCARNMWLEAATSDHDIKIEHRPGTELELADALSRKFEDPEKDILAKRLVKEAGLIETAPDLNFNFDYDV